VVLTQLETPIETVEYLARLCAREGVPLILDPAPARELKADFLAKVTWFTPNEIEADFFVDSPKSNAENAKPETVAQSLKERGLQGIILKLGARGAYVSSVDGTSQSIDPFAVKSVDSTAAGDAFNGAFAAGLMLGKSPFESARFASAAAAISVTRAGAQPSMPSMADVEQLLNQQK
jgi:ribokinase